MLALVHHDNPDGAAGGPGWFSGPGPVNFWETHFFRTVNETRHRGEVQIMVVNTEEARSLNTNGPIGGAHWFIVAWVVDPA